MKRYILLLLISTIQILNANEYIQINIQVSCSNSLEKIFTIKLKNSELKLTEDAVQDNLGGYVDIPEDRYYLKTTDKLYYLDGVTELNHDNNTNQFISNIYHNSGKFINIEELYNLKNNKDLKFFQKIILQKNNYKNQTTTNIFKVYFDENLFNKEYERCK